MQQRYCMDSETMELHHIHFIEQISNLQQEIKSLKSELKAKNFKIQEMKQELDDLTSFRIKQHQTIQRLKAFISRILVKKKLKRWQKHKWYSNIKKKTS